MLEAVSKLKYLRFSSAKNPHLCANKLRFSASSCLAILIFSLFLILKLVFLLTLNLLLLSAVLHESRCRRPARVTRAGCA